MLSVNLKRQLDQAKCPSRSRLSGQGAAAATCVSVITVPITDDELRPLVSTDYRAAEYHGNRIPRAAFCGKRKGWLDVAVVKKVHSSSIDSPQPPKSGSRTPFGHCILLILALFHSKVPWPHRRYLHQ
jgi:hypothetical protein